MIAIRDTARPIALALVALVLAACDRKDEPDARNDVEHAVVAIADEGEKPTEGFEEEEILPPQEIYYDLTFFDWYREGKPLVYDGRAFQPMGRPEALPAKDLTLVGHFDGVAFYVRADHDPPYTLLYVPVFEGYWLPFGAVSEAPQQTDD